MSWAKRDELVLVLAAAHVFACVAMNGAPVAGSVAQVPVNGSSVDELLAAMRAAIATTSKSKQVSVLVSDAWLSNAEIPWTSAFLTDSAADAHVSSQMELLGVAPAETQVVLDDAPFGEPRLASGIPSALVEGINGLAAESGLQPPQLRPLTAVVQAMIQRQLKLVDYAFAVLEEGAMSVALVRGRRIRRIGTQRLYDGSAEEAAQCWRRMQLRDPALAEMERLHVVDLSAWPHVLLEKDRLVPLTLAPEITPPTPAMLAVAVRASHGTTLSWQGRKHRGRRAASIAIASVSIALFAGAVWSFVVEQQELSSAREQLAATLERPVEKKARPLNRAEQERLTNLQEQLQVLEMPLDRLLIAIRPPADIRAALLSIEMSAARARTQGTAVRVVAEAASSADMAKYVEHLAQTPPFIAAHLTRHEMSPAAAGVFRFTIEASWQQ